MCVARSSNEFPAIPTARARLTSTIQQPGTQPLINLRVARFPPELALRRICLAFRFIQPLLHRLKLLPRNTSNSDIRLCAGLLAGDTEVNHELRSPLGGLSAPGCREAGRYWKLRSIHTTGEVLAAGIGDVPRNLGVKPYNLGFEPRVGIAYQLAHTTVIRTGFGISATPMAMGSIFGQGADYNPPIVNPQSVNPAKSIHTRV
jgi:hypothetical protein